MATTETLSLWIRLKDDFTKNAQKVKGEFASMTASFKKGMEESGQASNALASRLGTTIGMLKTPMGAAIAAAGGLSLAILATSRAGLEFAQNMQYVGANLDDFGDKLDETTAGVLRLSAATGRDQNSMAQAMEAVADAGFKGKEGIEVLNRAAMLARATHSDLAMTTDLVTKSMISMGLGAKDAGKYTEQLYKMSLSGLGNFSDMAMVMESLTATFRTAGLSADELMASVAHMSNLFPRNREAVMTMRSAIEAIRSPSEDAARLAEALGVEFNLASIQAKGFGKWMEELAEKTAGNEKVLDSLLGTAGAWKAVMAMTGRDGAQYAKILDDIRANTDKMGNTNARVMGTARGQWDILRASISSYAAEVWGKWDAVFAGMLKWINKAIEAYKTLDRWMRSATTFGKKSTSAQEGPRTLAESKAAGGAEDYGKVVEKDKKNADRVAGIFKQWQETKGKEAGAKGDDKWEKAAKAYEDLINREWQAVIKAEEDWYAEEKKLQEDSIDERFNILDEGLKAAAERWKSYQEEVAETEKEDAERAQDQADTMAEIAQADIDRTYEEWEALNSRLAATFEEFFGSLATGGLSEERKSALAQTIQDFRDSYGQLYEMSRQIADAMQGAFSDLFFDFMTGQLRSFKDYVQSFMTAISRVISNYVAEWISMLIKIGLAKLIGSIAGAAAGGAIGGASAGSAGGGAGYSGTIGHRGGYVGARFHMGGLASGEVPAILRRGEFIVNEDATARHRQSLEALNRGGGSEQGGSLAPVIHIHAVDAQSFYELCKRSPNAVLAPLIDNLNRSGSARAAIQGSI
jgi:TP901 family phage tail tape measure protein